MCRPTPSSTLHSGATLISSCPPRSFFLPVILMFIGGLVFKVFVHDRKVSFFDLNVFLTMFEVHYLTLYVCVNMHRHVTIHM